MGLLENTISGRTPRTSHAHVVDQLGRAIVGGEFAEGDLLPSDAELEARFQVSRTVVREAMKTLSAKGLIVARARIGTRVTERTGWNLFDSDVLTWHFDAGISEEFLVHVCEIRQAFEPFAAALAARRATPQDVQLLRRLAEDIGRPTHSAESLALADLRFHLALAEVSKNPFMRSVSSLIEAALVGIFKLSSPAADPEKIADVAGSHLAIVQAIARRDAEAARQAMEQVILVGMERVRQALAAA
ncbi:MAG: FadR/GntR family transcriptional regulator [Kiloniellaceae bacterium]